MVGRALREPSRSPACPALGGHAERQRDLPARLRGPAGRRPASGPPRLRRGAPAFQTAVETLRAGGGTRALAFDDAARVFGLVFAIENLFGNLGDFEERVEEWSPKKTKGKD
jgi:hypothetical protein